VLPTSHLLHEKHLCSGIAFMDHAIDYNHQVRMYLLHWSDHKPISCMDHCNFSRTNTVLFSSTIFQNRLGLIMFVSIR